MSVSKHLHYSVLRWWLLEPMNELLQQATEFGLLTHFDRRTKLIMHIKGVQNSGKKNQILMNSITMKELNFLFILYGIGITASIIVLFGEVTVIKYRLLCRNSKEKFASTVLRTTHKA